MRIFRSCSLVLGILAFGYAAAAANAVTVPDLAAALTAATAQIAAKPNDPAGYVKRGQIERVQGNLDAALADDTKALALKPAADTYVERALAGLSAGKADQAIADMNAAVAADSKTAKRYLQRGMAYLAIGQVDKAADDLATTARMVPHDLGVAALEEVVSERADRPSRLAAAAAKADLSEWPGPLVQYLLADTDEFDELDLIGEAVDAEAKNPTLTPKPTCLLYIVDGEDAVAGGDQEAAAGLFKLAQQHCAPESEYSVVAALELGHLTPPPPQSATPGGHATSANPSD